MLYGATAVGKTGVLTDLIARQFPDRCELISADSRQIYRGMDIGTAKPTSREREAIPHHLIDIIDPDEQYDIGRFVKDADRCVDEIRARGRIPIVAGGTGFYIRGFLYGPPGTPVVPPELREELRGELSRRGGEALHEDLQTIDPTSAAVIDPHDHYRILRALEVYRASGRPRSSFSPPETLRLHETVELIELHRPREDLYRRINARVAAMMNAGLPGEMMELQAAGYGPDTPGLQTIGYREFFEPDTGPPWSPAQIDAIRDLIARNTRRYAKRQETFFRRIPGGRRLDARDEENISRILVEILNSETATG